MSDTILLKAIEYFGEDAQKRKAVEELLELGQAILKDMATGNNLEQICEEFADVEIMLQQVKIMYKLSERDIDKQIKYKLGRLEKVLR